MAYVIADNIISPLGETTDANYQALKQGKSGLKKHASAEINVCQDYVVSLLSDQQIEACTEKVSEESKNACNRETLSRFELIALASASKAIHEANIDATGKDVVLIISSTKGAVEEVNRHYDVYPFLSESAQRIAHKLGITTQPIVVCNACISGVSALVLAERLLRTDVYHYAIVCGADCPGRFIISGFQSLKALSTEQCRPFDMDRFGLNLGEAAATIVLSREPRPDTVWQLTNGAIKNDAYHISAPSKTGEGLYNALRQTLQGIDIEKLALVSAHGTATLFNDQMESMAINRAGLSQVPTNALKGYFGHTLGAAGVLETILCMKQVDDNTILGTRGFSELGVSGKTNVTDKNCRTDKQSFVKLISGFGGCNATILGTKQTNGKVQDEPIDKVQLETTHTIRLSTDELVIDSKKIELANEESKDMLTCLYKQRIDNYPKFYKMDALSKLAFIASELLLQTEGSNKEPRTDRAIILFNRTSSIVADRKYLESIEDQENCFPSPSAFVYTLPNIATGEIAIRNGYQGETSFYIIPEKDRNQMDAILKASFQDKTMQSALTGWVDYNDSGHYEAELKIVERIN